MFPEILHIVVIHGLSPSRLQLGTVSLALFRTMIGLYCEDVMLQLVLR